MTPCPACDKPVDPLRSRFVGVRDGKVVAYCSAECEAGARPVAPVAARTAVSPATGVPVRIPTPPAGVPARRQTPAAGVAAGPPRPITPAPGVPIVLDSGPVIEILYEPSGSAAPAASAASADAGASDARGELRARHPDEIEMAAHWAADRNRASAVDAAPAPEPGAPGTPGMDEREAPVAEDTDAKRKVAARASSDLGLPAAPRRSRVPILLLILALVGGGGFLLYRYLVVGGLASATRLPAPAPEPVAQPAAALPPPAPAPVPAPEVVDPAAAVARAKDVLSRDLAATSPRVQRLAAAALARTQDAEACALLAAQINGAAASDEPRTSDIARLGLAYALARGGDRRGSGVLAAGLASPRADVRDEAARLLALLGDARGVPHLLDLLAVSQRRLGAAEHLAHLGEPRALKVLAQVRGDPRASADDRARATVALGTAGRDEVAGVLRDMLGDAHFNAFAAAALAELKDSSARPVLERQLASPPLRVSAARALRRLDAALDAGPLLPALLDAMRTGRDVERIPAAEAILLLAGPERWSAYD